MVSIPTIPAGLKRGRLVAQGTASSFGGPKDTGGKPDEGLYYYERADQFRPPLVNMLLAKQPPGTTGLFRQLATQQAFYVAYRAPKTAAVRQYCRTHPFLLVSKKRPEGVVVWVVDWGPAVWTGRAVDCSEAVLEYLQVQTDRGEVWLYTLEPAPAPPVNGKRLILPASVDVPTVVGSSALPAPSTDPARPLIQDGSQPEGSMAPGEEDMPEAAKPAATVSYAVKAEEAAVAVLQKLDSVDLHQILGAVKEGVHQAEDLESKTGPERKKFVLEEIVRPVTKRIAPNSPFTQLAVEQAAGYFIDWLVQFYNTHRIGAIGAKRIEAPK